jgi:TetR/AcrR family transcriptional regulator, regulator of autoinduction and epiphytic fitness
MGDVNLPTTELVVKLTRRERAKATRRRIAEAALARFSEHGYAATTMDTIAQDAGVAVQTVYFTFHTKAELLIAALKVAGGGPGAPEDVLARDWITDVLEAPTGPRRIALIVEHGNEIYRRVGPLLPAVHAAASVDPDVALAWHGLVDQRRSGMRRVMDEAFARRGELRAGLVPDLALDLLFGLHRAEVFVAFTVECGWSVERFKAWQFVTLARALLPAADADAARAPGSAAVAGLSFAADVASFQ